MQEMLIEKIRTDGGVQSRERINEEYVAELGELIKAGRKLPPADVYTDGADVWMADGFHRLLAHVREHKRSIRCNVHKGTKADAIWASCGANQAHGLRRTNADKRHAVGLALKARPQLSSRAVADHVGVDEQMVRAAKVRCGNPAPDKVIGKDGKTYRIPPPPAAPQGVTKKPPPPSSNKAGLPPPPGASTPPPPPPAVAAARVDAVDHPIPDHLLPLFDRVPEVNKLLSQISSIKGSLKRAEKSGDTLYGDCHFQAANAALETAYSAIKATAPHAVCPWCHGNLSDSCGGCVHRGVLGKHRWDTTVPKEMKR